MNMKTKLAIGIGAALLVLGANSAFAACNDVTRAQLNSAIAHAEQASDMPDPKDNTKTVHYALGGYGLPMWVSFVDESGKVCEVAVSANGKSGAAAGNNEWLGSRVISAQKANTANAFSIDGYAISTANLYSAVQPGGSLYGLQMSNPVDPTMAYQGATSQFGTKSDPMRSKRVGGINVFGGGLALYKAGKKIGAIGVSGDTSCRDHAYAWQIRSHLVMHPAFGITNTNMNADGDPQTPLADGLKGDEMIISNSSADPAKDYWNAWAQPACPNSTNAATTGNGTLTIPSAIN